MTTHITHDDQTLVDVYDTTFDTALAEGRTLLEAQVRALRAVVERAAAAVDVDPDCAGGKHPACPGWTWSDAADASVKCGCPCHVDQPVTA